MIGWPIFKDHETDLDCSYGIHSNGDIDLFMELMDGFYTDFFRQEDQQLKEPAPMTSD